MKSRQAGVLGEHRREAHGARMALAVIRTDPMADRTDPAVDPGDTNTVRPVAGQVAAQAAVISPVH